MLAAAALIAAGAPDAAAVPCSTRHLTLFEIYDTAALVAVASVSNAPRPMTSGAVDLDIVEQLKGAPVEHARAKENGSCTAGFYNVRTGKLARTALVFVGTDGHAVGYWSGVVEQPTPEVLDAIRAWRDAGSDPGKRTAALVAAIESPDQELSADAAYYLADEPALLRALDTAQLDRIWAKAGGAQWGPEIILARRRGPQLIALRSARALPRDLAALTGFDFEAITSAETLARTIERDRGTRWSKRAAALERCERLHGRRLERFSIYNGGRVDRRRWLTLARACRTGTPAP